MNRSSSTTISAELGLKLVVPQQTIVPLVASMYYNGSDPYPVRMAFHVGTDEPDVIGAPESLGIQGKVLNIELSSPFGQAHFEAPAEAMSAFLQRTYQIVPAGQESRHIDIETELNDLLRNA